MAEALGLTASVIAVVELFAKVGVLCSHYCAALRNVRTDVREILNEADRFAATLRNVERLLAGPNGRKIDASQDIQCGIADCRRHLDKLVIKLEEGTRYKNLKWPLKKEDVVDIVKKLERCRSAIFLDLQVYQSKFLGDAHREVVLAKLRAVEGATFDSHADAESSRCLAGTRVDILQNVQSWAAASDSECIFWLNGMAGTGKSTISRTIAQLFADKGIYGASFFFKRGEGDRSRAAFFFTTIASQLVHRLPSLAPPVQDAIEADPLINEKVPKEQFDKLIWKPFEELCQAPSGVTTIVVVVDALDECDDDNHARLIIHLLSKAKQFTSVRLKFFITSRPELAMRLGFKDISGKYTDIVLHELPKPVIEHDINLFLRKNLDRIFRDYNKSVSSNRQLPLGWPGDMSAQKLVEMAIPLFIFAMTICRFIEDRRLGGPDAQLAKVLDYEANKPGLDSTYLPVLDQLLVGLTAQQKQKVAETFKLVVGSIVTLARPLTISSLAHLLAISPDIIEGQLDYLHSVLSIPSDPTLPVQLLHLSFRDFLVDAEKGKNPAEYPFWVDERETHELLATQCLQLLLKSNTLKKDICHLRLPGTSRSEIAKRTIDDALPPEVQYACQYWTYHWKESKRKVCDGGLVDAFLTRHLLYWLEALALLGRIVESLEMVDDLIGLLDHGESRNVSEFLRDTRRMILTHRSIIDVFPLQIYCSALVFLPEKSVIRQIFRNCFPKWLSRLPSVDQDWDACLQTLEGHDRIVCCTTFSHKSGLLASGSWDGAIKLWKIATGQCMGTLESHDQPVYSVIFSPDDRMLASASDDGTIKIWDGVTCDCTATLRGHLDDVTYIAFSHDSSKLASTSRDQSIKLWQVTTGRCMTTLMHNSSEYSLVAFARNSSMLASVEQDDSIRIWDVTTGDCTAILVSDHRTEVKSLTFSYDDNILALASGELIELWNISTGKCATTLESHEGFVDQVVFLVDGATLVSVSGRGVINFWDIASGACKSTVKCPDIDSFMIAISGDGKTLAISSESKIHIWGIEIAILATADRDEDDDLVRLITASHDRKTLVLGWYNGKIDLWDCEKTTHVTTLHARIDGIFNQFMFSNDKKLLCIASTEDTFGLLNVETQDFKPLLGHDFKSVKAMVFSNDNTKVVRASEHQIKLWDVASGDVLITLDGFNTLSSVLLSADRIISSSFNPSEDTGKSTINYWDITTGCATGTFDLHEPWLSVLAVSHDGRTLATGDLASIKLLDTATGGYIATFNTGSYLDHADFDATCSTLYTNNGAFALSIPSSRSPEETPITLAAATQVPTTQAVVHLPAQDVSNAVVRRQGLGLSNNESWVTWDNHRAVWLPPAYRPRRYMKNSSVVAGPSVGIVTSEQRLNLMALSFENGFFV